MAYLDVTTAVILSPVPCVQVTVYDSVADYDHGGSFPPATPGVNRINADGTVERVRSKQTTDADGRSVWLDYECPQQEQVTYQAAIQLFSGVPPVSDPAMLPDVGPWLIDPNNPAGSVPIMVQRTGFGGWTRAATVSTTPIFGNKLPYSVESSVRQAPTGDLSMWVNDSATHDALVAILDTPGQKLFSWPRFYWPAYGQLSWAFVTTYTDTPGASATSVRWGAQLSLQPSARPAVVNASFISSWLDEVGQTWADAAGTTWGY